MPFQSENPPVCNFSTNPDFLWRSKRFYRNRPRWIRAQRLSNSIQYIQYIIFPFSDDGFQNVPRHDELATAGDGRDQNWTFAQKTTQQWQISDLCSIFSIQTYCTCRFSNRIYKHQLVNLENPTGFLNGVTEFLNSGENVSSRCSFFIFWFCDYSPHILNNIQLTFSKVVSISWIVPQSHTFPAYISSILSSKFGF